MRLDLALEARGLLPSRARARDAILRGTVSVNGAPARKPNQQVSDEDTLTLNDPTAGYVSRAALKLSSGLDAGGIAVQGKICLDLGASTGGFTQVLLERGAAKIFAVDVGHGQFAESLQGDERVVLMEGVNARDLNANRITNEIELLVCDISFVSVTKVLAAPLGLCKPGADAVILFKPQFEVGRDHIGKGGIVTNEDAIAAALKAVTGFLSEQDFALKQAVPSPIAGGDGNKETVLVCRRQSG